MPLTSSKTMYSSYIFRPTAECRPISFSVYSVGTLVTDLLSLLLKSLSWIICVAGTTCSVPELGFKVHTRFDPLSYFLRIFLTCWETSLISILQLKLYKIVLFYCESSQTEFAKTIDNSHGGALVC